MLRNDQKKVIALVGSSLEKINSSCIKISSSSSSNSGDDAANDEIVKKTEIVIT